MTSKGMKWAEDRGGLGEGAVGCPLPLLFPFDLTVLGGQLLNETVWFRNVCICFIRESGSFWGIWTYSFILKMAVISKPSILLLCLSVGGLSDLSLITVSVFLLLISRVREFYSWCQCFSIRDRYRPMFQITHWVWHPPLHVESRQAFVETLCPRWEWQASCPIWKASSESNL